MEKVEPKPISLTKEVTSSYEHVHLLRVNGEIVGFIDDEKKIPSVVGAAAAMELKKLEKPSVKITKQDISDGKEIHICTQSLGAWYNGRIKTAVVVDTVPIPKLKYSKPE